MILEEEIPEITWKKSVIVEEKEEEEKEPPANEPNFDLLFDD